MSENEYAVAVAEFLRKKGVTRCPTACAARPTATSPRPTVPPCATMTRPAKRRGRRSCFVTNKPKRRESDRESLSTLHPSATPVFRPPLLLEGPHPFGRIGAVA